MITLLLIAIAAILFLLVLGVYGDMARRTGFPILGRLSFLVAPVLYSVTISVVFLPIVYFVFTPLFSMDLSSIFRLAIPSALITFGLLVLIGSAPLWILHRKDVSFKKSVVLSARLMLNPVIDSFWAAQAVFIGTLVAISALAISTVFSLSQLLEDGTQEVNPTEFSLPFVIVFAVICLLSAYYMFKRGPSQVLSKYFYILGFCTLGFGVLAVFTGVGLVAGIVLFVLCVVLFILSYLYKSLGIVGVFGLEIALISGFFLSFTYGGASFLESIPVIGEDILSILPSELWTVALEIGLTGMAAGIIIVILAVRNREEGQVMTRAMAITIGVSAFMPLLGFTFLQTMDLGIFSSMFGTMAGFFLTFLLIGPLYLLSVIFLRLALALKIIALPSETEAQVAEEKGRKILSMR